MIRCRLKVQAVIDGAVREPGYEFTLKDGEKGPCTTGRLSHDTIDVNNDSNRILGKMKDVPLYDVIDNDKEKTP